MQSKVKLYILLSIMIIMLSIFGGYSLVAKANQLQIMTDNYTEKSIDLQTNTYFPRLINNYCKIEAVDSPFSIEIAALHQITQTNILSQDIYEEQYNNWYNMSFPTLIAALKDTGAGWTRIMIRWQDIQPVEGQPLNFSEYDNRLSQISQAGVKMIAIIDKPPEWASDSPVCSRLTLDHKTEYLQFLTSVVTRYRQPDYNIKTWEILNEPDLCYGDSHYVEYVEILKQSYQTIKAIDPSATILMGGIAYDWFKDGDPKGPFDRYFPDNIMRSQGGGSMDAFNFHYFPDFAAEWERWNYPPQPTCGNPESTPYAAGGIDIIAKKNYFSNRMNTCYAVNKPVWLTETGQHGFDDDLGSQRNQAYYVIQGYTRSLAAGIKNITWYELADNNDGFGQSLLFPDLSPKPGFITYKTLVTQLTNYRYTQTMNIPGGEGYIFNDSCGNKKIIAWGNDVPLTISPATTIEVTDYLGGVEYVEDGKMGDGDGVKNGSIQILLSMDLMQGSTRIMQPVPIPVFIRVTSR